MRSKTKPLPESRIWNDKQVASRLGRSTTWFSNNYERLRQLKFPARIESVGGFPKERVDSWIDECAGILRSDDPIKSGESEILAMLDGDITRAAHG